MKSQSNTAPELIVKTVNGYIARYNVEEKTRTNEAGETETYYEYDSVQVKTITKENLIEAIIRKTYSLNDELRMNRVRDDEFDAYNSYVEAVKLIVAELLSL